MSTNLADVIEPHLSDARKRLESDPELLAATLAVTRQALIFGITCPDSQGSGRNSISVVLKVSEQGKLSCDLQVGDTNSAEFLLSARAEDWSQFFVPEDKLIRPYQSYWGMLRVLGPQHQDIRIEGDVTAFARYTRVWRIVLDRIRDTVNAKSLVSEQVEVVLPSEEECEEDAVTGKYIWVNHTEYGKVKLFYETSGTGQQIILFLHTAGSDSRQYHSLMNDSSLQKACTIYAFDLPAHGRSSLGTRQIPESYTLTEQSYIESIHLVINKLKLTANDNLILCGASMAGHVCLAAAIHARDLGVRGVIPCEGCAHLPFAQPIYEMKGCDSSILDPERVCGMIAPTSPEYYKRQIWWQYSSQGTGVFSGDLKFYFKGWDGRDRMSSIDTEYCPVYMLTGEYDYSCTTESSAETAAMIKGAEFEAMKGLGHFPLTENPKAVLPYLRRAIECIQKKHTS